MLRNNNPALPLMDDSQLAGGFMVVANEAARNAIPLAKRKIGMLVSWTDVTILTKNFVGATTADGDWTNNANWVVPISSEGVTVTVNINKFDPADSATYYFGINTQEASPTVAGIEIVYISKPCTLTFADIKWQTYGVVGTTENISIYVRKNNTTDYLVETIGNTSNVKRFNNSPTSFNLAFAVDDFFEIKVVCPAWGTNPTQVKITGYLIFV